MSNQNNFSVPPPSTEDLELLRIKIISKLDKNLLKQPYREQWTQENPTFGFCSIASEAAWFILGGKEAGWVATHVKDIDGSSHWWLEHKSGIRFDPTADQYYSIGKKPPYERGLVGKHGGFMGLRVDEKSQWGNSRKPGLRAQSLLLAMGFAPENKTKKTFKIK